MELHYKNATFRVLNAGDPEMAENNSWHETRGLMGSGDGDLVHIHAAPAQHHTWVSTDMTTTMFAGSPHTGRIEAYDIWGNRTPVMKRNPRFGDQYYRNGSFFLPMKHWMGGSKQVYDNVVAVATMLDCTAACDFSSSVVRKWNETKYPGVMDVTYNFNKPGTYHVEILYRCAPL
jgi:hypothetical protein